MECLFPDNIELDRSTTWVNLSCPCCNSEGMLIFFKLKNVPVHNVLLMPTREIAVNYPNGDISLGFCQRCGFISNVDFDPQKVEYSSLYEERQGFSATYSAFAHDLATRLISQYDLHNKYISEIGYSKGELLTLICKLGGNHGVGIAPGHDSNHTYSEDGYQISFIKDLFSEKYSEYLGNFIICKVTLEHISEVAEFVNTVRHAIDNRPDTVAFFFVPDVTRILRDCAFEDIYYEHCSYFSPTSLNYLFQKCNFEVIRLETAYSDQYVLIEAKPVKKNNHVPIASGKEVKTLISDITEFKEKYENKISDWKFKFQQYKQKGWRTVIWGGGSKGVAFLTSADFRDEIEYVVDINPHKHGAYMPGTGHEVISPEFLKEYKPDVVIAMNPVYRKEIQQELNRMDLASELLTV